MERRPARLRGDAESGAVAVEFALLLPMLLLVLFGIIDFGRAWNMQITLSHAAREGVRLAALSTGDPVARTQAAAAPAVTGIGVAVTSCPTPVDPARNAQVVASKTFTYVTPIGGFLPTPTIRGKGEMRCSG